MWVMGGSLVWYTRVDLMILNLFMPFIETLSVFLKVFVCMGGLMIAQLTSQTKLS